MKELNQLNSVVIYYCWIILKKDRPILRTDFWFTSRLCQRAGSSVPVLLWRPSPAGFLLPVSTLLWDFLIIFLHLKFLFFSTYPFLLFGFKSCSGLFGNLQKYVCNFVYTSSYQDNAFFFFSLMGLLPTLPLFSHLSFVSYHGVIDCPSITVLPLFSQY